MADQLSDKANWLGRYLSVERRYDQDLIKLLKDAAEAAHAKYVALPDKDTLSNMERKARYKQTGKAINTIMANLFGDVRQGIKAGREDAAGAAADAKAYEDRDFLARLFPDAQQRAAYEASLQQQARRNIEAVMARELETKIPLSKQVYNTQSLSRGLIDREVNRALARGDGAKEIADAVRDMIRPDVRGGVSYAAMRLGRTEVHNAFHAQSRHEIEESRFTTKAEWHLSKSHNEDIGCICEDYAAQRYFDKYDIPDCPHPNCRCYITGVQSDWDDFEAQLLAGAFDDIRSDAMEPAPPVAPTTKAAQPEGWTGHPVAKAAANQAVIRAIDFMFEKYSVSGKAMKVMREGSRNVQVKGYRGGLSAPGKKAILGSEAMPGVYVADSESILYDMGRELTARTAYAPKSLDTVYRAVDLSPADMAALRKSPNLSMPLSRFEKTVNDAVEVGNQAIGQKPNVVFELESGARLASAGDSHVGLGQFEIRSITEKHDPTGGRYSVIRLRQFDTREFEADIPKGTAIPETVPVTTVPKPPGPAPTAAQPTEPVKLTGDAAVSRAPADDSLEAITGIPDGFAHVEPLTDKLYAADNIAEVERVLLGKYPDMKVTGFNSYNIRDLHSAQELAVGVDEMVSAHPKALRYFTEVKVGNQYAKGNALATCTTFLGIWRSSIELNLTMMRRGYAEWKKTKSHSVSVGWHTPGAAATPIRSTFIHEFGHLIDNSGTQLARKEVDTVFKKMIKDSGTQPGTVERLQWLKKAVPSRYSLNQTGTSINPAELIAESFADVTLRKEAAHPFAKQVVGILMKHAWKA